MASGSSSILKIGAEQVKKMMKPRIIASELLRKRVEDKARDQKYLILNNANFQILGADFQGYSPSLLVNSEGNSYLFNCNEGTQRFCYTNKIKLSHLENVFLTSLDWNRVSGLYGLSLTLQDVGLPSLCVHSTVGIEDFFEATRSFMTFNTGIKCTTRNHLTGEYADSGIRVQSIVLDGDMHKFDPETNNPEEGNNQTQKRTKFNPKLLAYICTLPDLPGTLDPNKCRELKVPVGPKLGILKSGKDVELDDGRVIKSEDVCGDKNLGLNFIVIDCPSEYYINHLMMNTMLNRVRRYRGYSQERQIDMVVHFSPMNVTNNPKYRTWMEGFADSCKHLLLSNPEPGKVNFIDCYRFQHLLHNLDSTIFPYLNLPSGLAENVKEELANSSTEQDEATPVLDGEPRTLIKSDLDSLSNVIHTNSMDKYVIRPNKFVETIDPTIAIDALYREAQMDPAFEEQLNNLRQSQLTLPQTKDYEPEVVFLGTGSALPSKLRNTSCILFNFRFPTNVSVMMDCGEDSYGQMYRLYGPEKINEVLKQLKMIYVSHHHADHHIGLIQLLKHRERLTDEPVLLLLPPGIDTLLNFHNQSFDDLSSTYEIYTTKTMITKPSHSRLYNGTIEARKKDLYEKLGGFLFDIEVVAVQHCINSCAVVMRFKIGHPNMDTFSIGYSGDARPCEDFVIAGKGCDLLIHEATFDHRSKEDALEKKHSTSAEAIEVARQMEAKFTILTHFSQRLPKIPYFTEEFDDKIGFAFDNMILRCPSHFGRLPILKPILSSIFRKSLGEIDLKHWKQEFKQRAINNIIQSK